jgi:hypothetical protein
MPHAKISCFNAYHHEFELATRGSKPETLAGAARKWLFESMLKRNVYAGQQR